MSTGFNWFKEYEIVHDKLDYWYGEEDGMRLSEIKNVPCRLIFEGGWGSRCVGFGHFMKDKFVLTEEFAKIDT